MTKWTAPLHAKKKISSGLSTLELIIATAIAVVVISAAFNLFSAFSAGMDSPSKRLLATTLLSEQISQIKLDAMRADLVTTDPEPVPPLLDDDPPNPPAEPINTLVLKFTGPTGTITIYSYKTECRISTNTWFAGTPAAVLTALAAQIAKECGARNPCPTGTQLPRIRIIDNISGVARYIPPSAAKPKPYGLHAAALCISWRPEGGETFDIKAVGAYPVAGRKPAVVITSTSISNARLGYGAIKILGP